MALPNAPRLCLREDKFAQHSSLEKAYISERLLSFGPRTSKSFHYESKFRSWVSRMSSQKMIFFYTYLIGSDSFPITALTRSKKTGSRWVDAVWDRRDGCIMEPTDLPQGLITVRSWTYNKGSKTRRGTSYNDFLKYQCGLISSSFNNPGFVYIGSLILWLQGKLRDVVHALWQTGFQGDSVLLRR